METDEALLYALVDLTFGVARTTDGRITDLLAELDLTHALANALWQVAPAQPAPSMRELAARLRCDPSTVTFLVDRLERRGLVERRVDPANRRVRTVVLTAAGERAREALVAGTVRATPLAGLAPREQRDLRALLAKALAGESAAAGGASAAG